MSDEQLILTQRRGPIFEVILNRVDERNALNHAMMLQIGQAMTEAERLFADGEARVVFIRANGRVFSSGIDIAQFQGDSDFGFGPNWRANLFPVTATYQAIFNQIEACSMPVIGLLHGYCLGMALEMALACDFRIAAERTRIGLPESRLGIIPDVGGTVRLVKLVGPSRAKEIIMTGSNFDLATAERWGLINYIVPKDALESRAEALAEELVQAAPLAVSYAKRVINDIMANERGLRVEAWAQAQLFRTEDFENGIEAMLNKTYPVDWQGK